MQGSTRTLIGAGSWQSPQFVFAWIFCRIKKYHFFNHTSKFQIKKMHNFKATLSSEICFFVRKCNPRFILMRNFFNAFKNSLYSYRKRNFYFYFGVLKTKLTSASKYNASKQLPKSKVKVAIWLVFYSVSFRQAEISVIFFSFVGYQHWCNIHFVISYIRQRIATVFLLWQFRCFNLFK